MYLREAGEILEVFYVQLEGDDRRLVGHPGVLHDLLNCWPLTGRDQNFFDEVLSLVTDSLHFGHCIGSGVPLKE